MKRKSKNKEFNKMAEVAKKSQELALQAIRDTERLNWLERHAAMVNVGEAPGWEGPHVCVHDEHFKGKTYREVIDKAMRAMNQ